MYIYIFFKYTGNALQYASFPHTLNCSTEVSDLYIVQLNEKYNYQEERVGIPFTCLNPPHLCVCPKLTPYVEVLCFWSVS